MKSKKGPVALALGLLLLAFLIWKTDPAAILERLTGVGWQVFWLAGVAVVWRLFAGTGLWLLFHRSRPRWIHVVMIRMGGEALNTLTPFFSLGGEPVKALMLRRYAPIEETGAVVLLDKTAYWLASMAFMAIGVLMGPWVLNLPGVVWIGAGALLVGFIGGSIWFVRMQAKGGLAFAASRALSLIRIRLKPSTVDRLKTADEVLSTFWADHKPRFVLSVTVHMCGRVLRTADVWIAAWLIGVPLDIATAFFIAAVAMTINILFVFIPGALGVAEGGQAALFKLFGLAAADGLTVGLLRRARTMALAICSLPILLIYSPRRSQ